MPCPCDCDSAKLTLTRCATSARNPIKVEKNRLQELNRFGFVPPRSRPVLLKLKGFLALFRNIMKPDPPWIHAAGAPVAFPTQRSHDSVVG